MPIGGRTVIIDDQSPPGAWADAIAHTPRLSALSQDFSIARGVTPGVREGEAGPCPPVSGPASPIRPWFCPA